VNGDEIADLIAGGIDHCKAPWGVNGDAVSVVTYNPGPDMAYTMWFGNICGALGFGYGDGCTCC
jgi:hypothetical protein